MSLIQTLGSLVASGSALGVLEDFGFCPDVEDFDQVYDSCIVESRSHRKLFNSTSATTGFKLAFKKRTSLTTFQIFNSYFVQTREE